MDMKNLNLTVEELKILAENGQRDFIYGVGYYYENGIRTSVDYAQAAQWYEKAAKKDHIEAAMHLALLYAQGRGVEKDDKKALFYMNQAAKSGNMNAQSAGVVFAAFSSCKRPFWVCGYSGMALGFSAALWAFCVSRARTAALSKSSPSFRAVIGFVLSGVR